MKNSATVLVLLALLALIPCSQATAQMPQAPVPAVAAVAAAAPSATAPADNAEFLASLSTAAAQTPSDLAPAPSFMTGCTSNAQCPTGTLCCYPCGIDGCTKQCITPIKGRCPLFV
jgi:hypothetical protein